MLNQIGILIVDTIVGFVVYLGLLRFYMQAFRAPFRNPVGQFVIALTDWGVQPLRKIVPGVRGLDMASFAFAFLLQVVLIGALYVLFAPDGSRGPEPLQWFVLVIFGLIRASLHLLIVVVIIDFVLSWVNPHTPFAPVLRAITGPFYGFFRRFIPPVGGFDLSPLFLMLLLQIALIMLGHLESSALRIALTWARRTPDGWMLSVHVQPGARRNEAAGLHGESLKLRIQAPPVDGKANEAVIAFLAARLGVRRNQVRIVGGETSREKRVAIDAPDADPTVLVGPA